VMLRRMRRRWGRGSAKEGEGRAGACVQAAGGCGRGRRDAPLPGDLHVGWVVIVIPYSFFRINKIKVLIELLQLFGK
jgi:hypothetical protein